MGKLEYLYRWPDLAPGWVLRLDHSYGVTYNALIYAITDVKRDLARLNGGVR